MKLKNLITVMLPTRERPNLVERSVRSLLKLAKDPSTIEILVAYDEDDTQSIRYFSSQRWHNLIEEFGSNSMQFKTPPWGYQNLHNYYNLLAEQSNAHWLMLWNDDAVMETQYWDQQVAINQTYPGLLKITTSNFKKDLALFPLVPRAWIEMFGSLSLHNLCDSWIQEICEGADAVKNIDVIVFHDRFDVTGNNNDQTYQKRKYRKKVFNSEEMKLIRHQWSEKLRNHLTLE